MVKKRYIAIAIIFMAFIGLQIAETTNAAKLIDSGQKKVDGDKITWRTYQYKNYILSKQKIYNNGKLWGTSSIKIQRFKKKIILVTLTQRMPSIMKLPRVIKIVNKQYIYSKSSLSLRKYYFKYLNPRKMYN
ncbi:hypothetical protein [Methanobacterium alcaliphilum]|uniref:hypothetical protein n=1 Tax=Methanobacterium alcaliphilum TaxID=392018 RepID=UPI002009FFAA|nr:hypothetical protein [Methanobacterium alcaliphilum]MCK9150555.1 hypothetical protein [Methanobacterium alcaliphilum]